jgi:phosphate transport system substrate-binding protein
MPEPRSGATLRALVILWIGLLAGFAAGIEWIKSRPDAPPPPSGGIDLVGAGATFPYPLYRRWFAEYGASSGVRINYFSVGSGEGIRLMLDEGVDFGATDRPLRADERARAVCGPLDVPTVVGAIAVAYNLPGLTTALHLDADALAGIFLGHIAQWDASELRALNPALALPALPITVVHRVRTSGTSEVFARYLAGSPAWRRAQSDAELHWPVGTGAEGNEGVATQVRVSEGAIGFVEFSYAQQAKLQVAALRNASGRFVLPDASSLAAAASDLLRPVTADTISALVGAPSPGAYAVAAMTRIVADSALADATKGAHLVAFMRWALTDGARSATELGYAALPPSVSRRFTARLDALRPGTCPARAEQ